MDKLYLYEKLEDRLECELEDYSNKIENSANMTIQDAEIMDLFLHSLKSLKTIMAMEGYAEDSGYTGSRYAANTYSGNHNAPTRNYYGRRENTGRYSRDSEKEDLMRKLDGMVQKAASDEDAMAIRNTIDILSRSK